MLENHLFRYHLWWHELLNLLNASCLALCVIEISEKERVYTLYAYFDKPGIQIHIVIPDYFFLVVVSNGLGLENSPIDAGASHFSSYNGIESIYDLRVILLSDETNGAETTLGNIVFSGELAH